MSKDVVFLGGGTYAGLLNTKSGVLIEAKNSDSSSPAKQPKLEDSENTSSGKWQTWGIDNMWPTRVRKLMSNSTVAAPLIYKAVCQMYGLGLVYYQNVRKDGKLIKDFSEIPEIEDFLERNPIDYIALERMMDFKYYNNMFQEFIYNSSRTDRKIIETHHLEAEFSRLSIQDKNTHEFEWIGYFGDWSNVDEEKVTKIMNIPWKRMTASEILKKTEKQGKFAVHSKFPGPGKSIYGAPPHQALYNRDGWLVYSNEIPKVLNAFLNNGMNIKYHIRIPANYWRAAFPKWDAYDDDERTAKKKQKLSEMNEWLTGANNSMKSFISEYAIDKITGKALPGWEIEEVKDSTTFNKEILSSQESDAHISRALGIDPSLAGLQPAGGKMGAGSGSDKRTAFQNAVSMTPAEQLIVLDFLYVIGKINNWPSNVKWAFQHEVPTSLNENKSGSKIIE